MKKLGIVFFILISSMFVINAAGSTEGNLYYFPTNVVNNQKVMINLASPASSTTKFEFDFKNSSTYHLELFRIRDTLYNGSTSGERSRLNANNCTLVDVTIESIGGYNWNFVHENNPTKVRPFELECFCVESKFKWSKTNYDSATAQNLTLNGNTTLSKSNIAKKYWTFDGSKYVIGAPTTDFSNNFDNFRAWYMRDFDVCVKLTGDYSTLEPGYYSTKIKVSATYERYTSSSSNPTTETLSEEIEIRGYIGLDVDTVTDDMTYSFSVSHASDTYSMNLGDTGQNSYYDVAKISFLKVYSGTSQYGGASNETTAKSKYDIYISPTPIHTTGGTYSFRKLGSENQLSTFKNTIQYDLYARNTAEDGYVALSSSPEANAIKGTMNAGGITADNGLYKFRPLFGSQHVSSVGGKDQYVVTWKADLELYLKVAEASRSTNNDSHSSGIYYSYLYVTLVVN